MGWTRGPGGSGAYSAKAMLRGDWAKVDKLVRQQVIDDRLYRYMPQGLAQTAVLAVQLMRDTISGGSRFAQNRPLTIAIKRSSTPLVDLGTMEASVTSSRTGMAEYWVGVPTHARQSSGADAVGVAEALHDGKKIRITRRMRGMFIMLARAAAGTISPATLRGRARVLWNRNPGMAWKPLKKRKRFIKIPPRPFVTRTLRSGRLRQAFVRNMMAAARKALTLK